MRGAGHGSMKKHRKSGVKAARLRQQARNRAHAASVNDLIHALNASHVSARSATRQRLLSQKRKQHNPFQLASLKQLKGKKLNTINELSNLLGSMTAKFSTVKRAKKSNKMSLEPTRRSARHSKK